jgi:hypothetical protein
MPASVDAQAQCDPPSRSTDAGDTPEPLARDDLGQLIADAFIGVRTLRALAQLVQEKTAATLLQIQFLHTLAEEGLLASITTRRAGAGI